MRRLILKYLKQLGLLIFILVSFNSCFVADLIESDKPKKKSGTKGSEPKKTIKLYTPDRLPDNRLIRRLTIDMLGQLPEKKHFDHILVNNNDYLSLVESILVSDQFAKTISKSHLKIWDIEKEKLHDLEKFAETDATLAAALTSTVKDQIKEEPTLLLRYILQEDKSFSNMLTSPWTISHKSALNVWGKTSSDIPWIGEPYRFYKYKDKRPEAGMLAMRGFHSVINTELRADRNHATYEILNKLFCIDLSSTTAHSFSELTEEELSTDLTELAKTKQQCAGCHLHMENIAPDLSGFSEGEDLANWIKYTSSNEQDESLYTGLPYSKMSGLAKLMSTDSRFHICEVRKIFSHILQRPINENDLSEISSMYRNYIKSNYNLKIALRQLYLSRTFSSSTQGSDTHKKLKNDHSGIKYLNNFQLKGIINQISNVASQIEFPAELSPGGDISNGSQNSIASGQYFHLVKKFSFSAAKAIIDDELADNKSSASRKLLTQLPDGSGYTATDSLINNQIIEVWYQLTSTQLVETDALFTELKNLWVAGSADGTTDDEKSRKAWKLLLIGMLMSPEFISY